MKTQTIRNYKENRIFGCNTHLIQQRRSKKSVLNVYNVANYINFQIYEHPVSEMFIRQLLQLKGMSVDKATAIRERYPTTRLLIDALQRSDCNGELLLSSIELSDEKRQLGAAINKTIYQLYTKKILN